MRRLADLEPHAFAARLRGAGLSLDFGAARARIRADVAGLGEALHTVYGEFGDETPTAFHDVTVDVRPRRTRGRSAGAEIEFVADGESPFEPFPAAAHLPLLEWGMNFLLAQRLNHRLLLHAGVVALGERAVVMPALPGTGKSTLTVALALSGFRLLSDEFGVVGLEDGLLHPLVRPAALKNDAIDVVLQRWPQARVGPRFAGTRKGTVAHIAPDAATWRDRRVTVRPALVLFPRYEAGARLRVEPMAKGQAFAKLAANSFNYETLGPDAFDAVGRLVKGARVSRITYGDLTAVVDAIRTLATDGQG